MSFFNSIGPTNGTSVALPSRESTDHGLTSEESDVTDPIDVSHANLYAYTLDVKILIHP